MSALGRRAVCHQTLNFARELPLEVLKKYEEQKQLIVETRNELFKPRIEEKMP